MSQIGSREATDLLVEAEFAFPAESATLWTDDDGLPDPEDAQFAQQAAAFIGEHPVPTPDRRDATWWNTERTASRQCKCLAYLASGRSEARRAVANLCIEQAIQMQWSFPIFADDRSRLDPRFCAAAATLALTGALLRRGAEPESVLSEVATQWLRTGMGRFVRSGDKGDTEQQHAAEALIRLVDTTPQEIAIHGTDSEFFSQLDLKRPEMHEVAQRVNAGDLHGAKTAYVDALANRFAAKRGWPDINFREEVDIPEVDDICRNVFILQAHMFKRCDFGEEVDWAKVIDHDIESRVWMNAHPWLRQLTNAYLETGDEKCVTHLCRLFNSWYEKSPPTFERTNAQWRTLEVGNRVGQKWGTVLLALSEHATFKQECLFNMARSMLDHGKYLSMYAADGGNWLQVESSALACIALFCPEFKLSPLFYEVGMSRLTWANAEVFLPDGFQSECSPQYHRFPLTGIVVALKLAKFMKAPVPEALMGQYEAGVEALQHIAYPNRMLPMLSDTCPLRHSAVGDFEAGAEVFARRDFRWLATNGREGTPPAELSHDFTHAGYCVMRDKWGPDGQVLIFDAGNFGSGHQHEDKLNFVLYGGGRELIGDPGIYSYKADEFEPYWRGTWSHNSIVIDGLSQHRILGPEEAVPDPDRRFVIDDGFDFAVGWYRRAYSPRQTMVWAKDAESDRQAAIRNVQHQRCIFYVKGEYVIVCDRVQGEGEHQIDILFHPAPIETRAVDLEIQPNGVVVTTESEHANVAILPAQGGDLEVLDLIGQKDPPRGWFALFGIQPSHDIVYRSRRQLPAHFETVVQPLPAGRAKPMKMEAVQVRCEDGKQVAGLACGGDLFLLSYDGPAKMECRDVIFEGTALLLRHDPEGQVAHVHTVDRRALSVGGKKLKETPQ